MASGVVPLNRYPSPALGLSQSGAIMLRELIQAAGPYGSLLIIAQRFGLDGAGYFSWAQALTLPIFQLLSFQLKPLMLTHSAAEIPLRLGLRLRTLLLAPTLLAVLGLSLFGGLLVGIMAASRALEHWAEMYQSDWQRHGQAQRALLSSTLRTLSLLGALLLAPSAEMGFGTWFLLSGITLLACEFRATQADPANIPLKPLLWRGSLLGIVLFLQAAQASFPRLALEHFCDRKTLGLFATLTVVVQAGNLLASGYGQSLLPRLAESEGWRLWRFILFPGLFGLLLLGVAFAGRVWFSSLAAVLPLPLETSSLLLVFAAPVFVWPAAVVGCALTAKRLYRTQIFISLALNVIVAASSYFLIPRGGLPAALLVLAISGASMLVLASFAIRATEADRLAGGSYA